MAGHRKSAELLAKIWYRTRTTSTYFWVLGLHWVVLISHSQLGARQCSGDYAIPGIEAGPPARIKASNSLSPPEKLLAGAGWKINEGTGWKKRETERYINRERQRDRGRETERQRQRETEIYRDI